MAERDMPAVLDKALETTKQAKMYLAGQSMGGTVLFAFLAKNHNYDDKVCGSIGYIYASSQPCHHL